MSHTPNPFQPGDEFPQRPDDQATRMSQRRTAPGTDDQAATRLAPRRTAPPAPAMPAAALAEEPAAPITPPRLRMPDLDNPFATGGQPGQQPEVSTSPTRQQWGPPTTAHPPRMVQGGSTGRMWHLVASVAGLVLLCVLWYIIRTITDRSLLLIPIAGVCWVAWALTMWLRSRGLDAPER